MDAMDGLVDRRPRDWPQAFCLDVSPHLAKVRVKVRIPSSAPTKKTAGHIGGYSAPMTLKFWLTKTWCGQLTPM
jgi:hypothetical protein